MTYYHEKNYSNDFFLVSWTYRKVIIGGSESKEFAGDLGLMPEDLLKKGMVTHSSILAWRIPWTEEPGGL